MDTFIGCNTDVIPPGMTTISLLQVPVIVHREQNMKKEDQQDATIRCLLLTSVSTCFGHHYAHLQENKGPFTAFGVLFWFCWM